MTITLSQSDYWALFEQSTPEPPEAPQLSSVRPYPACLGQGYQRSFELREGLDLTIDDFCLRDDLIVTHCDRVHPVEYTFEQINTNGQTPGRYSLYGSGLAPGEAWRVAPNTRIISVNVHIEPELLGQWMGAGTSEEVPAAIKSLLRSPDEKFLEHAGTSTAAMQMTVQQILNCPFQGLTQRLYLESKVWELMALLIEDLRPDKNVQSPVSLLKADDVERIHDASKILRRRLLNPPSLMELARAIGINDHKLKVGFRQVFGTTVFGYLHEQRLERSRQLLEVGNLSVTEASQAVGFTSRGHFAAAFRRKYGVNPGVYARQRRGA